MLRNGSHPTPSYTGKEGEFRSKSTVCPQNTSPVLLIHCNRQGTSERTVYSYLPVSDLEVTLLSLFGWAFRCTILVRVYNILGHYVCRKFSMSLFKFFTFFTGVPSIFYRTKLCLFCTRVFNADTEVRISFSLEKETFINTIVLTWEMERLLRDFNLPAWTRVCLRSHFTKDVIDHVFYRGRFILDIHIYLCMHSSNDLFPAPRWVLLKPHRSRRGYFPYL